MRALNALLALVLIAALLTLLAANRTRLGINLEATQEAALWQRSATPWDFHPRTPDDLIAGRAFGDATVQSGKTGVRLQSATSKGYEIGVRLVRAVPLDALPQLVIDADADAPWNARISLAESLQGERITSEVLAQAAGTTKARIDLARVAWHGVDGQPRNTPTRAAMLRLVIDQAEGQSLTLHALSWHPRGDQAAFAAAVPRVTLPRGPGAENLLALRDHIHTTEPLAIVRGSNVAVTATPRVHPVATIAWLALLGLLIALRRRARATRVLAIIEIFAVVAPPIAFAVGLQTLDAARPAASIMLAASLVYGLWLAAQSHGRAWRFGSRNASAWLLPLVATAFAFLAVALTPVPAHMPGAAHLAAYLAWATVQQLIMLAAVATRLWQIRPSQRMVIVVTASVFALVHAPNGMLMVLCLGVECFWAWLFLRHRAVLPIALAHALGAMLLQSVPSGTPLRSLEIGARFLGT